MLGQGGWFHLMLKYCEINLLLRGWFYGDRDWGTLITNMMVIDGGADNDNTTSTFGEFLEKLMFESLFYSIKWHCITIF